MNSGNSIQDLETSIMKFGSITERLDVVADYVADNVDDCEQVDKVLNMIIGIKELYNHEYDIVLRHYEKACSDYYAYKKLAAID